MDDWDLDFSYTIGDRVIPPDQYGQGYLQQYLDIVARATKGRRGISLLEWGAGLTTIGAFRNRDRLGLERLVSVESDQGYRDAVAANLEPPAEVVFQDLTGPCIDQRDSGFNYSTYPTTLGTAFDVIFIDGRRRMECAFVALTLGDGRHTVILHDYRRDRYQIVRRFYDVVEEGEQFLVLSPRRGIAAALRGRRGWFG